MQLEPTRLLTVGLALAVVLVGCRGAGNEGPRASPEPATGEGHATHSPPSASKLGASRYPHTEADVDFMSGMIGHHAQALVMSGWAPTHGASPPVRRLAERIVNGQQDEIATMQRWLEDRGQPVPEPGAGGMKMGSAHHGHEMLMPGMLTETEMKELDQARGSEFDRLFLTYMIQHHRGAVTMVRQLFGTPGAAQDELTFKLASDISADQSSEISRMERMLAETPSARSP
jgi:uncharacterized protein (DUF305 family)